MPMCLREDKNRTGRDENQTVRCTCPHRTAAQKQLSTAGAKADLLSCRDRKMEEKHKLCRMTSFLRASAKSWAGRDATLRKHQESAAAALGGIRAPSRNGVGQQDPGEKQLASNFPETLFQLSHPSSKSPSHTHSQEPSSTRQ